MITQKTRKKMLHWMSKFIEDVILPLTIFFFIAFYWGTFFLKDNYVIFSGISSFLIKDLGKFLMLEDNSIVTVATVFIGIYFSIYTMFTSIQTDSVIFNLGKKNFQKLLNILGVGFLSSFAYTLYSIFFETAYNSNKEISVFFVLLMLIIFMLSAFQFGVVIYIILKNDISSTIEELDERKKRELKQMELQKRLEEFLEKESEKEDIQRAREMSKIIKDKQNNKSI